ncbi:hypothetical protein C8R43DRAFT_995538 [Mycena crocata]|nr:hypothetical protein C8R43DRAFT_995538 [Mycena crocata]
MPQHLSRPRCTGPARPTSAFSTDTEHLPDGRSTEREHAQYTSRTGLSDARTTDSSRAGNARIANATPASAQPSAAAALPYGNPLAPSAPMHHAQRRVLVLSSQPRTSTVSVFALRLSYAAVGTSQRSSASSSRSSLRRVGDDVPSRGSAHAQTHSPALSSCGLPGANMTRFRTDAVASFNSRSTPTALHVSKNADPRPGTLLALTPTRPGCASLAREWSWSVYTGRIVSCAPRPPNSRPVEHSRPGRTPDEAARFAVLGPRTGQDKRRTRRPRLSEGAPATLL